MRSIQNLIQQFCPDGVPFEPLADVGQWYGGGTPSKDRAEFWKDGTIPWVSPKDMGRAVVDSTEDYITDAAVRGSATRLVPPTSVAMVVRSSILDRLFPIALVPVAVALNQDMKAVVPRGDILPGYVAHLLRSRGQSILRVARKTGGSVASIDSGKLFAYRIPVPPPEVQKEIVEVLDSFSLLETELEAEIKAELEARRRQYTFYRDQLLTFVERERERVLMGKIGKFIRGRRFTKNDIVAEGIPAIHYGEIYTRYGVATASTVSHVRPELKGQLCFAQPGDVVIATVGETIADVAKAVAWLGDGPVAIHDDTCLFRSDLNPKYVSYAMQTADFNAQKNRHVARAKVKRVSSEGLAKIAIPVPSRDEQDRIVETLDRFDALVNDLSVGLPAELQARRLQYGYYRDRLLTFQEAA